MHILLADDTMDTLLMYSLAFTVAGHKVHLAHDGKGALAAAQTQHFDAILIDVEMPRLSGWEVATAIRQLPQRQHVPIVLFTAHYEADFEHRMLEVGANRVVEKPMMPDDLLAIITQLVADLAK